jgi:uncharacterized membrane protein (DUF2068 family)
MSPEIMTDPSTPVATRWQQHNKFLVLIAAYKSLQALLFIALGVGALRLLHKDVGDVFEQIRDALHFNPESRLINLILEKVSLVDDKMLRRIGAVAFSYAALSLAEGIGLYLEKAWGEVLTLAITVSFLPWEIFEIVRHVTWVRVALLIINLLVFFYLFKTVAARRMRSQQEPPPPAPDQP